MALIVPNKQHAVEPPLRPNECMLRVTIRLDLHDQTEVSFARAALMRLNVRHAKASPDVLAKQIMRGDPVSKLYWEHQRERQRRSLANYMVGSDPRLQRSAPIEPTEPVVEPVEPVVPVIVLGPPGGASSEVKTPAPVVVQNFLPPAKRTWTRIFERRMPKPKLKRLDSD